MRQITTGIANAHADRVTAFEHRVLTILETAKAKGTHLNTRLVTLKAFDYDPPIGAIVATRAALRALEWMRIIRRVVQGEGQGQSAWALRAIFVSEGNDGMRPALFSC